MALARSLQLISPMTLADRRVAIWIFLLAFATYAYCHAGGGWTQNSQLELTRAIVERHTFAIDAYASNTGDLSFANDHVYSNKSPALSWIAAPPYAAMVALERTLGLDPNDVQVVTLNAYVCTLACVAFPGALIPALLYGLARRRGFAPSWSVLVALAAGFATQLLPYATIFMVHVPSALLLLYAVTGERGGLAGFAAGLATAMNYLGAIGLLFLFAGKQRRRFVFAAAVPLLALAAYQQICFGSFLTNSVSRSGHFLSKGAALGVFQWPTLDSIYGVTLSPYRGVFFFVPALLVAALREATWVRDRRAECALALLTIVALVLFNISFNGWEAGFSVGRGALGSGSSPPS